MPLPSSPKTPVRISRDIALRRLRELAKQGLTGYSDLRRDAPLLLEALLRHFGTLSSARRRAGLPPPSRSSLRWTRETIVAEFRRLHRQGVRLTTTNLKQIGRAGLVSVCRKVGGVPAARRIARVPEPAMTRSERSSWDEARVIEGIHELHAAGESLASSKVPTPLYLAARRYFGSWASAIEAAGFDYKDVRLQHAAWSRNEIIAALQELAAAHPRWTPKQIHAHPVGRAAHRRFGSLKAALDAAALGTWGDSRSRGLLSRTETLALLRARHAAGQPMSFGKVRAEDGRLVRSAARYFSTWDRAVAAAGVTVSRERAPRWTKKNIVTELRRLSTGKRSLQAMDVKRCSPALFRAIYRHYGSFDRAAHAAGIPVEKAFTWQRKDVIKAVRAHLEQPLPPTELARLRHGARKVFGSFRRAVEVARVSRV